MFKTDFYDLVCEYCKAELRRRGEQSRICDLCRTSVPGLAAWVADRDAKKCRRGEVWSTQDILDREG